METLKKNICREKAENWLTHCEMLHLPVITVDALACNKHMRISTFIQLEVHLVLMSETLYIKCYLHVI